MDVDLSVVSFRAEHEMSWSFDSTKLYNGGSTADLALQGKSAGDQNFQPYDGPYKIEDSPVDRPASAFFG